MAKSTKGKGPGRRLTPKIKAVIVDLLGEWARPAEVVRILQEEYDCEVSVQTICNYQKSHAVEIEKLKEEFIASLEKVPVANKMSRLLIRQRLIDDLLKPGHLWYSDGKVERGNHLVINKILDSIRTELEGAGISDGSIQVNILQQVLNMDPDKAAHFVKTGELKPIG